MRSERFVFGLSIFFVVFMAILAIVYLGFHILSP